MPAGRRRRVPGTGRALLALGAASVLAACGGAPPARPGAATSAAVTAGAATPAVAKITAAQACRLLRADFTRNHGVPGIPALRRVADHVGAAPRLAADARTAVRDIDHTGVAPLALVLLRDDCSRAGVPIPAR
jgi:hypothetical protein